MSGGIVCRGRRRGVEERNRIGDIFRWNRMKYQRNPVVRAGGNGEWDSIKADNPFVMFDLKVCDKMWYHGQNLSYSAIGYATSSDGIQWTKYSENPILKAHKIASSYPRGKPFPSEYLRGGMRRGAGKTLLEGAPHRAQRCIMRPFILAARRRVFWPLPINFRMNSLYSNVLENIGIRELYLYDISYKSEYKELWA